MKAAEVGPIIQANDQVFRSKMLKCQFANPVIFFIGKHGDDRLGLAHLQPLS